MKKVALSLLAFGLAATLGFAQDAPALKISGSLQTGAQITVIGGDIETTLHESDSGKVTRLRLNGAYENSNSGVKFRLEAVDYGTSPSFAWGYVWSKFADGLVTVYAGKIDNGTFSTGGDIDADFSDVKGALIVVTPATGLNLGATWAYNTATDPLIAAFQFAYSQDKLFRIAGGVKLSPKVTWEFDGVSAFNAVNGATSVTDALFGASFTGIQGLTLKADTQISQIGTEVDTVDLTALTLIKASEVVEYAVTDAFTVGLVAYEHIFGADYENADGDVPFGYSVKPYASYKVSDMVTVAGEVQYAVGPEAGFNIGGVAVSNDVSVLTVKPNATFTLSPNASVVTALSYVKSSDADQVNYGTDSNGKPIASQIVVNIDFRYSF